MQNYLRVSFRNSSYLVYYSRLSVLGAVPEGIAVFEGVTKERASFPRTQR
jgi:hypothetical protein